MNTSISLYCFRYTEDGYLSGNGNVTSGKYERMEWDFNEEVNTLDIIV